MVDFPKKYFLESQNDVYLVYISISTLNSNYTKSFRVVGGLRYFEFIVCKMGNMNKYKTKNYLYVVLDTSICSM